jgi:superfamily II DNA/RNA helicase
LRSGAEIIIATPGRLLDLMGRGCANHRLQFSCSTRWIRMLDMGSAGHPARSSALAGQAPDAALFCATLSKEIEAHPRVPARAEDRPDRPPANPRRR